MEDVHDLLTRALEQDVTVKVVASVGNGEAAVKAAATRG